MVDAAVEEKAAAEVITEARDGDGVPTPQTMEGRRLKENYARMVRSIENQLAEYKAAVQRALSKEQYKEFTEGVEELSELLFVQLREVCTNLEKTRTG